MFIIVFCSYVFFFFKQKTAYEMRISDWSSDVCSSDLSQRCRKAFPGRLFAAVDEVRADPERHAASPATPALCRRTAHHRHPADDLLDDDAAADPRRSLLRRRHHGGVS